MSRRRFTAEDAVQFLEAGAVGWHRAEHIDRDLLEALLEYGNDDVGATTLGYLAAFHAGAPRTLREQYDALAAVYVRVCVVNGLEHRPPADMAKAFIQGHETEAKWQTAEIYNNCFMRLDDWLTRRAQGELKLNVPKWMPITAIKHIPQDTLRDWCRNRYGNSIGVKAKKIKNAWHIYTKDLEKLARQRLVEND